MKRTNRKILLLFLPFCLCLAGGCSQNPQEANSPVRVGFSHAESVNSWRMAQINSFRQKMETAGFEFVYTEPLEYTQEWQLGNIQQMLVDGLDFLILIPLNTEGYEEIAQQAKSCGTQIISLGQSLDGLVSGDDYLTCIYYDYVLAGELCGRVLAEHCKNESYHILEIKNNNPSISEDISAGFHKAIDGIPNISVIHSIEADGNRITTQKLLEKILIQFHQEGIQIDAVFAHNDEDGLGALNAMKMAGMDLHSIDIVSINGIQDVFKAIIAEEYLASVTCSPMIGPIAYNTISLYLDDHRVPPYVLIPCLLVDSSNARTSYINAY